MKALGWYSAIAIGVTIVGIELLPVVFGTGEDATVDWSFTYVTFRFVLPPLACVAHILVNLGLLLFWRDRPRAERLMQIASISIPTAFLVYSRLHPLPMFGLLL